MPGLQFPISHEVAANLQRLDLHAVTDYVRTTPYRAALLFSAAATNSVLYNTEILERDKIPEPWDLPDHAGNISWSLVAGAMAGQLAARATERILPGVSPRITRAAITVGALAAGATINWLVESHAGQQLLGEEIMQLAFSGRDTGDGADFVYGTFAATAASTAVTADNAAARRVTSDVL